MAADYFTINMGELCLSGIKFCLHHVFMSCSYDVIYWLAVVGFYIGLSN